MRTNSAVIISNQHRILMAMEHDSAIDHAIVAVLLVGLFSAMLVVWINARAVNRLRREIAALKKT